MFYPNHASAAVTLTGLTSIIGMIIRHLAALPQAANGNNAVRIKPSAKGALTKALVKSSGWMVGEASYFATHSH